MGERLLIYNYYTIYYNAVQHPYNKIKRKFDIKKALHKRHLEYLRIYNCRTTEKVIKQEKTNARMDCFDKLFEKGMDIFEVLELIGISQNDIELINDAAYVWQDKHL